jgi:antitoxin component YwqK of YwqJK toxin-antitoxin module
MQVRITMTLSLLLLLCSLLFVSTPFVEAKTDRELDGFTGAVRTIVVEKTSSTPMLMSRSDIGYDQAHVARWQPDRRDPVRSVSRPHGQTDQRLLWHTAAYDPHGKRTEEAFYTDEGTLRWKWRYTYDPHGRRTERTSYDTKDIVRWTWRYTYTEQGHIAAQTEHNVQGELVRRWQYTYDTAGNITEESHYHTTGMLLWRWRYAYDAAGNQTEKIQYTPQDAVIRKWHYRYDAQGQLQEEHTYNAFDTLLSTRRYTYDSRGNVREEQAYKADGSLQGKWQHTYDYDAHGNWIKRATSAWLLSADGTAVEPSEVTYRTLTYY